MMFDLPPNDLMQDSQNHAASVAGTPKSVRKEKTQTGTQTTAQAKSPVWVALRAALSDPTQPAA